MTTGDISGDDRGVMTGIMLRNQGMMTQEIVANIEKIVYLYA